MMHNSMCTQDQKRFSETGFQESKESQRRGTSHGKNSLFSVVHKSPEFLSQLIAEREKQIDTTSCSIHVNPKFLEFNGQPHRNHGASKQSLCIDAKSHFHYVNRVFLHGKLVEDKNLAVSQSCFPGNQNLRCSLNSGSGAKVTRAVNKIVSCPDNNVVVVKSNGNENVTVICENLLPRSVYVNPNFAQPCHMPAVELGIHRATNFQETHSATQSADVIPKFTCLETPKSFKLEDSNCDESAVPGKHFTYSHAKLADKTKCVYVNPNFTVSKRQSCKEHSSGVAIPSHDKVGLLAENGLNKVVKLLNSDDERVLHLPNTRLDLTGTSHALKVPQGDSRATSNILGKKRVAQNSSTSHALSVTDVSASKDVHRNSLIVLSRTKLVRSSVKYGVKMCQEQQTMVVSNSNKKLVKRRRSVSLSSKSTRSSEPCGSMKLAPRLSPLPLPVKTMKSPRTKYKIIKTVSTPNKQAPHLHNMINLGSAVSKLQKCGSLGGGSSEVANGGRSTKTSPTFSKKNIHRGSLVLLSKTKLVRHGAKCLVRKNSRDHQTVTISNNARKLVRRRRSSVNISPRPTRSPCGAVTPATKTLPVPPAVKVARSVRTKYKYIRSLSDQKDKGMVSEVSRIMPRFCLKTKYNIDRRAQHPTRVIKRTRKYCFNYGGMQWHGMSRSHLVPFLKKAASQRLFTKKPTRGSLVWKNANYMHLRQAARANRRLQRILRRSKSSSSKCRGGVSNMVRIGGVLYRRSVNKLTRTSSCSGKSAAETVASKAALARGNIVHIRGSTFLMEPTGRTLRRVDTPSAHNLTAARQKTKPPVTRIDIGGVTFLQKSLNVLIRTDYHRARNILSQAKQRSIATLMQKMKKNNQPCVFYQRFGKCPRKDKGSCLRVHDPKQIAVCRKFLQGLCQTAGCLLSHDVVPEKMATCRFFLEGICVRDNCPYLHVKLNSKAGICIGFLQGYCADGDKCQKRHINLCPEFDRLGKCSRGKFCPYPHKVGLKYRAEKRELPRSKADARPQEVSGGMPVVHRYYDDPSISKPRDMVDSVEPASCSETRVWCPAEQSSAAEPADDGVIVCKRRKLETMPDYIAFS